MENREIQEIDRLLQQVGISDSDKVRQVQEFVNTNRWKKETQAMNNLRELVSAEKIYQLQKKLKRRVDLRSIRDEPHIGKQISEYLPEAGDRSRLIDLNPIEGGSFVKPDNRDVICLPEGDTFRTNPDKVTGCGPFASLDAWNCCEQTDLAFCSKVAAVMRKGVDTFNHGGGMTHRVFNNGRIVREIRDWMQTYKLHLIPFNTEVSVDTTNDDDVKVLKLAMFVKSSITMNIMVSQQSEDLDASLKKLNGIIHVRAPASGANTGATVSFQSVRQIAAYFGSRRKLIIHCPVDMAGFNANSVVHLINIAQYTTLSEFEYEFPLPLTIPVRSLGPLLIASTQGWVNRPRRHDGPVFDTPNVRVEVAYDLGENRILVRSLDK